VKGRFFATVPTATQIKFFLIQPSPFFSNSPYGCFPFCIQFFLVFYCIFYFTIYQFTFSRFF